MLTAVSMLAIAAGPPAARAARPAPVAPPAPAATEIVTIDSPRTGERVNAGRVGLSGRFQGGYDVNVIIDGADIQAARVVDPEADDTGTWHYDLDTTAFDGEFQVIARATAVSTRYHIFSAPVTLVVDNPAANVPTVAITAPAEGARVTGPGTITVRATGRNPVTAVAVRVNGGPWWTATPTGPGTYAVAWDPRPFGDTMASIEARAADARGHTGGSGSTYVALGAATAAPPGAPHPGRALWLWEDSAYDLLDNPGGRGVLASVAGDTATYGNPPVTTIYLGVGGYAGRDMLRDDRTRVADLLAWAHGRGWRVYALIAGGTRPAFLGALDRYRSRAVREFEKVLDYNLAAGAAGRRFDGVNVDIEPYIMPAYFAGAPLEAALEATVREASAGFAGSPGFGGIALHHYDSLLGLPSVWGPSAVYPPVPPDTRPPTAPAPAPVAAALDHRGVLLRFGRSSDDGQVTGYRIYRSTYAGFAPGPATLAGQARALEYVDAGLRAATTWYYRVTAVDARGNEGPASAVVAARTAATSLRPVVVDTVRIRRTGDGGVSVTLRVVDRATGRGVRASVTGWFTRSAGRYATVTTGANGYATATTGPLAAPTGAAGFAIHRIVAPGRCWAAVDDRARPTEISW